MNYQTHNPRPKRSGQSVIAHISDLHFIRNTNVTAHPWPALAQDLSNKSVDVVVVTGDLIDSSVSDVAATQGVKDAFGHVHRYLTATICTATDVDPATSLFVIPGNHDFRWKGLSILKSIQYDAFYSEFGGEFRNALFPSLNFGVFVFDSNTDDKALNFATGLVKREDLTSFEKLVSQIATENSDLWGRCTKIALVHHHPMPIAATEHRESITDREEFLLLKNAAMFMTEMVRSDFDLVLHGHKHYPAFSTAAFPSEDDARHGIAVVAAGSVGKTGKHEPSYNLLTVFESGEIKLERRVLRDVSYEREIYTSLESYPDIRKRKFWRLARSRPFLLKMQRYVREEIIARSSGDTEILEEYSGVASLSGQPVPRIEQILSSRSGRFLSREYESNSVEQRIRWKWISEWANGQRKAETVFDPPIGNIPISFRRKGRNINSIHFNRKDRLDATGESLEEEENVSAHVKQAYNLFTIHLRFPRGLCPRFVAVQAVDPTGKRDLREEEYANPRTVVLPESDSVSMTIDYPLPGYTYRLSWSLPGDEESEHKLSSHELGKVKELIDRLLRLRSTPGRSSGAPNNALKQLADAINASPDFVSTDLEVALFVRNEVLRGLVCVSAYGPYSESKELWDWVIKPGVGIAGQAYRRREDVLCTGIDEFSEEVNYYEVTPGRPKHTVLYCSPLLFPVAGGHRIAILSLGSSSNLSKLLRLPDDEAALLALKHQIIDWYANILVPAVGMDIV
jgi:predicted MPP superfamily phosphohydrolase